MYMKTLQLSAKNVVIASMSLILIIATGYFVFDMSGTTLAKASRSASGSAPVLSADKKFVMVDKRVILSVDDAIIFNWFKTSSQLCDGDNITSVPDRKAFCENKTDFLKSTRFAYIVLSPDNAKIGFAIESDTLAPDKVIGVFSRVTGSITLVGGYYLGNEFIGFSPKSTNFVYKSGCFEGKCALSVSDVQTFVKKASVSDSISADARTKDVTFVKWLTENSLEYKLGEELKQVSF
jgi:hypothetical protein